MHSGDGATVIITASSEGNLAHRTVRSVLRAASLARQQFPVEILAILDAPTAETQAYFARHAADFSQILRVAFEDVSLARNYAVQRAHGRYVTFVTAADLVSSNWLLASVAKAQELDDDRAVFHCEYNFDFSAQARVTAHIDERSPAFSLAQLFDADCWPGICLAERGLVLDIPFASANRDEGWGHADWHWNCEVIAAGGAHHVVPGTAHFVRADSAISAGLGTNAERPAHAPLMRSTRLLDQWEEATRRHTAIQPALAPPRPARQARLDRLAASLRTRIRAHVSDKPRLRAAARRVVTAVQAMQSARKAIAASELLADPLPDWLIDQWRAMHEIEPTLLPTADRGANIPRGHATSGAAAEVYLQAAARWRADRTHVFLLPWMKRGGSDLVVLHQMRALAELGCDRQLCLTTEACDSPWLSELPAGTDVLEFGKLAAHLSDDARLAVLAHLLVQRGPSHVHCINSALGLRLFARHGRALGIQSRLFASMWWLGIQSRLFASMWCPDYSLDGYSGYANEFLFDIFPHLTTVFCDNRRFVDELVEKYDFDRERFQVLDFPTRVTAKPRCAGGAGRLEVLWASRLDRQKTSRRAAGNRRSVPVAADSFSCIRRAGARGESLSAKLRGVRKCHVSRRIRRLRRAADRTVRRAAIYDGVGRIAQRAARRDGRWPGVRGAGRGGNCRADHAREWLPGSAAAMPSKSTHIRWRSWPPIESAWQSCAGEGRKYNRAAPKLVALRRASERQPSVRGANIRAARAAA